MFAQMENVAVFIHSDTSNVYVISPQGIDFVDVMKELHSPWRGGMHYNFFGAQHCQCCLLCAPIDDGAEAI